MPEVRTRDEAIALVDTSVEKFGVEFVGVLTQAAAKVRSVRELADSVVRRHAQEVAALQAAAAAAGPDAARDVQARLQMAMQRHERAKVAAGRVTMAQERVDMLDRLCRREATTLVSTARAHLRAKAAAIGSYHGGAPGTGSATASSAGAPVGAPNLDAALSGRGLASIDVAAADLAESPLQGSFGRGGAARGDYRWAVQTWADVVGPGVARGMTRDDFAARDTASGAPPLRRTAEVFDLFMGDTDRIRVDRRPDGSLNVVNGRHRLQVARELGIQSLPGQVFE